MVERGQCGIGLGCDDGEGFPRGVFGEVPSFRIEWRNRRLGFPPFPNSGEEKGLPALKHHSEGLALVIALLPFIIAVGRDEASAAFVGVAERVEGGECFETGIDEGGAGTGILGP